MICYYYIDKYNRKTALMWTRKEWIYKAKSLVEKGLFKEMILV